MAFQTLLLFVLLTSCTARVLQRDNGLVRAGLNRYFHHYNSTLEKRQDETGLPQLGGEIYFIEGILCHCYFATRTSIPDTS